MAEAITIGSKLAVVVAGATGSLDLARFFGFFAASRGVGSNAMLKEKREGIFFLSLDK